MSGWSKNKQRVFFKKKINDIVKVADFIELSKKLESQLSALNLWKKNPAPAVASYRALSSELSPHFFEERQNHCHFVFPRTNKNLTDMEFVSPQPNTNWKKTSLGILEATQATPFPTEDIQIFLVPGLVFDRRGRRLGRGLGLYDRVLAKASGIKIGVTLSQQICNENLTEETHDIPMDALATENFTLIFTTQHSPLFNGAH